MRKSLAFLAIVLFAMTACSADQLKVACSQEQIAQALAVSLDPTLQAKLELAGAIVRAECVQFSN